MAERAGHWRALRNWLLVTAPIVQIAAGGAEAPRPAASRRLFDVWSRVYDAPLVQAAVYRPVHDVTLLTLLRAPDGAFLDLGCGTGLLTTRLARLFGSRMIVGCDFSRGMLGQARERRGRASFVNGDAQHLPFESRAFAAVVSTHAFHWFPDQRAALAEIHRILKPNGRMLLALVNPRTQRLSDLTRRLSVAAGEPLTWPTRRMMHDDVTSAGFRVVRQVPILGPPGSVLMTTVLTVAERRD